MISSFISVSFSQGWKTVGANQCPPGFYASEKVLKHISIFLLLCFMGDCWLGFTPFLGSLREAKEKENYSIGKVWHTLRGKC